MSESPAKSDGVGEEGVHAPVASVDQKPAAEVTTVNDDGAKEAGTEVDSAAAPVAKGKPDSLAKLVRTWEAYMNNEEDAFPQLQMLEKLQLCGNAAGLSRLTGPLTETETASSTKHLAPPALIHTHSSPLKRGPSLFDTKNEEDVLLPPAIPLNQFQRSSSTPSKFRSNSNTSAFGTPASSAFTLPSQRVNYASMSDPSSRHSAFDPVQYYASALDDMERTSIEVLDVSTNPTDSADGGQDSPKKGRKGAAFRAARFLSDMRSLRRRRRARGGRENPFQPVSSGSQVDDGGKTEVQVFTEVDAKSSSVPLHECDTVEEEPLDNEEDAVDQKTLGTDDLYSPAVQESDAEEDAKEDVSFNASLQESSDGDGAKEGFASAESQYQKLDSDVEDDLNYQRIEASLQTDSPGTVPSPSYQQIVEERPPSITQPKPASKSSKSPAIRIRVSNSADSPPVGGAVATPSPTELVSGEASSTTPRSTDSGTASPGTTRSSNTGSSSGHTTQAASTVGSSHQSGLSTISETDREVMEANKQVKNRLTSRIGPLTEKSDNDGTSLYSESTNSSNPAGYLALEESPVLLREGATNVPADRYFMSSPSAGGSSTGTGATMRTRTISTMSSKKSGNTSSPSADSSSAVNTSSSSSSGDEPPTFVSYLDRQRNPSDLTSTREASETSSPRALKDREERDGSPSEIVGYPNVIFQQAAGPREQQPTPVRPGKQLSRGRLDKNRALPPRSPVKGTKPPMTPPPRGSVSPLYHQQLSPPRNIIDHPDSSISRPHVMRGPVGQKLLSIGVDFNSPLHLRRIPSDIIEEETMEVETDSQSAKGELQHDETCIEVLTGGSADEKEAPNLISPEKEN